MKKNQTTTSNMSNLRKAICRQQEHPQSRETKQVCAENSSNRDQSTPSKETELSEYIIYH